MILLLLLFNCYYYYYYYYYSSLEGIVYFITIKKIRYAVIIFFNNELTLSWHLNLFSRGGCHLDN